MDRSPKTRTSVLLPNTLGVPCMAENLRIARSEQELIDALSEAGDDALVLGAGSNLILPRRVTKPLVQAAWRSLTLKRLGEDVLLTAAAGENWHAVVRCSLGQGLRGLENLALIPGSVGAAPVQNIGAYGVELSERLVEVRVFDRWQGRVCSLRPEDCAFGYRTSIFKQVPDRYVVLAMTLRLGPSNRLVLDYPDVKRELVRAGCSRPTARQVAEAIIAVRRRKLPDPRHRGNVGSFFQNPIIPRLVAARLAEYHPSLVTHAVDGGVKLAAAQLIDLCGWKGRRLGKVGVWRRQPLVLINLGGAEGADFLVLSERIRASVLDRFGVRLELEPTCL